MNKDNRNILLGCLIALVIIVGVVYAFNSSKEDSYTTEDYYKEQDSMDSYYRENMVEVDLEARKNIEYKEYILNNKNLLFEVRNKNNYDIVTKIYVELYDKDKELIAIRDGIIRHIGAGKTGYTDIYIEPKLLEVYETYEAKVMPSYEVGSEKYYHDKEIKFISLDEKKEKIKFKNNYNKKLDVTWAFLYYDVNGNIVDYSTEYVSRAKANKITTEEVYLGNSNYDRIKVILLEAESY